MFYTQKWFCATIIVFYLYNFTTKNINRIKIVFKLFSRKIIIFRKSVFKTKFRRRKFFSFLLLSQFLRFFSFNFIKYMLQENLRQIVRANSLISLIEIDVFVRNLTRNFFVSCEFILNGQIIRHTPTIRFWYNNGGNR